MAPGEHQFVGLAVATGEIRTQVVQISGDLRTLLTKLDSMEVRQSSTEKTLAVEQANRLALEARLEAALGGISASLLQFQKYIGESDDRFQKLSKESDDRFQKLSKETADRFAKIEMDRLAASDWKAIIVPVGTLTAIFTTLGAGVWWLFSKIGS